MSNRNTVSLGGGSLLIWAIIFCLTDLLQVPLRAQPIPSPSRVINTRDGLPQSFVSGLLQDKSGFVWVSTRNGLARFDGRQFKAFLHNQLDSTTLSSNVLISMRNGANNCIWIEHQSGEIDRLSPNLQRIERISRRSLFRQHPLHFARRGWVIDVQDRLWGTQLRDGIWCYDWHKQRIHHYTHRHNGLPSDTIRGLLASVKGSIWILSRNNLSRLDVTTGKIQSTPLPVPIDVEHLPTVAGGTVQLHECQNGELLWADKGQLTKFSPNTRQFRVFPLPDGSANGLSWFHSGRQGEEYVTAVNQIYRYDARRGVMLVGQLERDWQRTESLLIDQSGLLWLGTNATGIQQIDLSGPRIESHANQTGFHPDLFQQELNVSLAEIFDWPASDESFRRLSYYPRSTYDSHHRLWVGLRHRAGYYDSVQRRFVMLPPIPTHKISPFLRDGICGMDFDPAGNLWCVDNDGNIVFMDTLGRKWTTWLLAENVHQIIPSEILPQDLFADENAVWLTTQQYGLMRIDRKTKQIRLFSQTTPSHKFPSNQLLGMISDPYRPNLLWIGSYAGLICFDKTKWRSCLFTAADGLPDNTVYSLLADRLGYLWLSTNKGLCRFDPRTHQVRIFTTMDGLPGDEFNRFHSLRLVDGRLAFGGTEGWILLDPASIHNDLFQPPVVLTALHINNQTVEPSPTSKVLPLPIEALNTLVVPFNQNTLSFDFAGLEYNQPTKLRYRYQLEGYNQDWVMTGFSPQAIYTQLPPGPYTLRLGATNKTGQWSSHIRTLTVIIKPPWWRTNLAYLIYLLSGIGLLHYYIRYRTQREGEQQQLVAQQRESEQLRAIDALKDRFFANITHEFRTPITLILTPTEQLKQVIHQPEHQRRLETIDRNAHQLLTMVNQLLDLSKLEAKALPIEEAQGDLVGFVENIVAYFREQAEGKSIQLYFHSEKSKLDYWFDDNKLERIIVNLIANALKFTSTGGQIHVHLSAPQQKEMVQLTVSDTGIGIPADKLAHIFERFYRIDNSATHEQAGTGIGLALVKELVDLQGGYIQVTSQPGAGSTFKIQLPYRVATSSPDTILTNTLPDPPSESHHRTPESVVVLVIEDNSELAHFIATSLPTHYTLLQASNGEEGLRQALEMIPDVIISDVLMPVMDGYTLVSKLKADWRTSHIPVILLTAKSALESRLHGLSLGADDYLTKPFHIRELQLRVQNRLERCQQLRAWLRASLVQSVPEPIRTNINQTDPFLELVYQTLDEHLNESGFGPDELIAQLKVSRMAMYRKLKALTDLSTGEFIRSYRLKRATEFLQQGLSSTETAYQVGFESPAYFTKCFRDAYQLTPSEFAIRYKI